MARTPTNTARRQGRATRALTLAELLVVTGVLALLMALVISPMMLAKRQAQATRCAANLKDISVALQSTLNEYDYYPVWDDGGAPTRYTWVDVLYELRALGSKQVAYCPEDPRPSPLNAARAQAHNVRYPADPSRYGIDYSYGIGVPLSSGARSWRPGLSADGDDRPRQFVNVDRNVAQRLLVADAEWSYVYNLSSNLGSSDWSHPSQFDNLVAYRHARYAANVLCQDGHVSRISYQPGAAEPVSTTKVCLWYPGEPFAVDRDHMYLGNYYPDTPPLGSGATILPGAVIPQYYTANNLWSNPK